MKRWIEWRRDATVPKRGGTLFSNNRYHVIVHRHLNRTLGGPDIWHLSIRNNDRSSRHDWRDFQRIKNEFLGPECEAVEVYPAESNLADTANQYHLWALADDNHWLSKQGIGFTDGRFLWDGKGRNPRA